MPYFAWRGITLDGSIKKGKQCARSQYDLDAYLLKRDIALLNAHQIAHPKFVRMNRGIIAYDFLQNLSVLLSSGILLPQALLLLANQQKNSQFQDILFTITDEVHHGNSLRDALKKYPQFFDAMTLQMVHVGQEIGSLDQALAMVIAHHRNMQDFKKQLKSAALMPAITLIFFCMSALAIFLLILPRFALLFKAAHQQLPPLTQSIVAISEFLQSPVALCIPVIFTIIVIALYTYVHSPVGKKKIDYAIFSVPFIGVLVHQAVLSQWLCSLAMLLKGGIQLVPALKITHYGTNNLCMQEHLAQIVHRVQSGSSLSHAMQYHEHFFNQDVIALVMVGEESNKLEVMLAQAAHIYQASMQRSLMHITTLFQPVLMIIMGLLITGLIFAVYLPVFNLAQAVG